MWTWDSVDTTHRKPLRINNCGGYHSGLLHGYTTSSFYPKYGTPRAWQTGADRPVQWADNVFYPSSSDFTGAMHAVAQVLMGSTKAPELFDPSGSGFKAEWSHTHGIYLQDIGGGKRKPWLISISSAGIYARELPHCAGVIGAAVSGTEKGWDASYFKSKYGFYPQTTPTGFFTLPGDWTLLADAAAVADFYAKSAIYTRCGWAFNSTGLSAVNTGYVYESDATTHGYKFSEYVITITIDVDGAPTGATMGLNSSGHVRYVWNGTAGEAPANLVVPNASGTLSKFDFSLSDTTKTVIGTDGETAPLVSWYDQSDNIKGMEHNNGSNNSYTKDNGAEYSSGDPLPIGTYTEYDNNPVTDGNVRGVYYTGEVIKTHESVSGRRYVYQLAFVGEPGGAFVDSTNNFYPGEQFAAWQRVNKNGSEATNSYEAGVIPVGARASAYRYTLTSHTADDVVEWSKRGFDWFPENNDPANLRQRGDLRYRTASSACGVDWTCGGISTWAYYYVDVEPSNFTTTDLRSYWTKYASINASAMSISFIMPTFTPQNIEVCCPNWDPNCRNYQGWCANSMGSVPVFPFEKYNQYDEINTNNREESLRFIDSVTGVDTILFTTSESAPFSVVLLPIEGNDYLFKIGSSERMYCWSDSITGQIVYSDKMNGDTGPDLDWVDSGAYPLVSITATIMHSWVGVPGDSTT